MKKEIIKHSLNLNGILSIYIIQRGQYRRYPNQFNREITEFVKGFQPDKEVSIILFEYCPFDAVKSIFLRFFLCFPAVKVLNFWHCRFSDENLQQLNILKLNRLQLKFCNIPEVSSFCSLLKSINSI
eukprot:snap_masked-scaffold_61-processed-gene-0.54-mRNA-1 protein AED:1.00 eAED:1.00 QI:0/0/0/0/1/1/5/0/126